MEAIEIEKEILEEKKSISHLRKFLIAVAIGMLAGFAIFYYNDTKQVGRQTVDNSVTDVRLQNLDDTIAAQEKRIAKLEELVKAQPAGTPSAQVSGELNDRLNALEKAASAPKSHAAMQNSEQVFSAITLLSTFHHLSAKILSGKPFTQELAAFKEKFSADGDKSLDAIIAPLMPYGDSGVPSVSSLISSFDEAAANQRGRTSTPPEGAGLWDRFVYNLSRMVSIRRVDKTQTGTSPAAVIGRAEDDLSGDAIDAALKEIQSLPDNLRGPFAAWMQDAQIAILAPGCVEQIEEQVMKKAFSVSKKAEQ